VSTHSPARPAKIAVVEDNAADVYLLRRALQQAQVSYEFYHLPDGEAAIHFFLRQEPYCDAPRPDLLVLDVHLPRVDGFQVLQHLRERDALQKVLVIALTTTSSSYDRAAMEALGVNHYGPAGAFEQLWKFFHNCSYRSPHIMEGHRARGPRIRSSQPLARFIMMRLAVKR
jgi:CheY-like chemotaxis protein